MTENGSNLEDPLDPSRTTDVDSTGTGKTHDFGDSLTAFLKGVVALFAPSLVLFLSLKDRSGGIPMAITLGYSLLIPYISSDRFLEEVPWERIVTKKFLLLHCAALAIVYAVSTLAMVAKPHIAGWFTAEGRKGSLFDLCLLLIVVGLAYYECSWASRQTSKEDQVAS